MFASLVDLTRPSGPIRCKAWIVEEMRYRQLCMYSELWRCFVAPKKLKVADVLKKKQEGPGCVGLGSATFDLFCQLPTYVGQRFYLT